MMRKKCASFLHYAFFLFVVVLFCFGCCSLCGCGRSNSKIVFDRNGTETSAKKKNDNTIGIKYVLCVQTSFAYIFFFCLTIHIIFPPVGTEWSVQYAYALLLFVCLFVFFFHSDFRLANATANRKGSTWKCSGMKRWHTCFLAARAAASSTTVFHQPVWNGVCVSWTEMIICRNNREEMIKSLKRVAHTIFSLNLVILNGSSLYY